MPNSRATIFVQNRRNSNARKLFLKVVGYFAYCYQKIIQDKVTYSESYVKQHTSSQLEDYLKKRLVHDYLRKRENKLAYQEIISAQISRRFNGLENLLFYSEPEEEFVQNEIERRDKIDILVANLGLSDNWNDVDRESLHFVFECKRLLNTRKSDEYLSDTVKFIQRSYSSFRFPFNGMLGFVEKGTIPVLEIIEDIEKRLSNHTIIKSIKSGNKILQFVEIDSFDFCRLSQHQHNSQNSEIEVIHLFFDYSGVIVQ